MPRKNYTPQDLESLEAITLRIQEIADRLRGVTLNMASKSIPRLEVLEYKTLLVGLSKVESFGQRVQDAYHDVLEKEGAFKAKEVATKSPKKAAK